MANIVTFSSGGCVMSSWWSVVGPLSEGRMKTVLRTQREVVRYAFPGVLMGLIFIAARPIVARITHILHYAACRLVGYR